MVNYEIILTFLGASMLLTIMPGPDILYVLTQSISNGKKYGIATTIGLVSGIFVHTSLVAFGISVIIKQSAYLYLFIKIAGALYLFYLAYLSYKSDDKIQLQPNTTQKKLWNLVKQGFLMNVLNPKVTLFFMAFFPGFLYSATQNTVIQFYILGFIFQFQAFIIFGLVAILAGNITRVLDKNPKTENYIKWAKVFIFIGIGIAILW